MLSVLRWPTCRLKELTYSERFLTVARRFPCTSVLRKLYQWATGGGTNILRVRLGASEVSFQVHSPREYREIESNFLSLEKFFLGKLAHELREGDVFLDVGSSLGEFAVPMAKAVGKDGLVIAVEPNISRSKELEENVRLNGFTNVRIFRNALSDQAGEARLWTDGACPTLFRAPTSGESETVRVDVGDVMMDRERLPVPKAVKIDVEGFEYNVIRGLKQTLGHPACKTLCCEIHPYCLPDGITPQVIIDEVKSLGFGRITSVHRVGEIQIAASKEGESN